MIMPFGKHKGRDVRDIPNTYLAWVLDNCNVSPSLKRAIEQVLFPPVRYEVVRAGFDLNQWYRRLALEFHPDRAGGSHEAMKAINRAYELAKVMDNHAAKPAT